MASSIDESVQHVLTWLEEHSEQSYRDGLTRYGITAVDPFGVSMKNLKVLAKELGRNHDLTLALWKTNRYEARMLCALIGEVPKVTPALMERWCRDFDSWAICDTLCFTLWDRSPHAWTMIQKWSDRKEEFVKRAAFALIASLALHNKKAANEQFLELFPLIEKAATDPRNFVKKGVSWALRGVGRRNALLNAAAVELATKLAASTEPAARWVGKDTLRDITKPRGAQRSKGKATQ